MILASEEHAVNGHVRNGSREIEEAVLDMGQRAYASTCVSRLWFHLKNCSRPELKDSLRKFAHMPSTAHAPEGAPEARIAFLGTYTSSL
jgi:hypothetical protein